MLCDEFRFDLIKKSNVLHVMHYDKFNEDYILFCERNFDISDHVFFVFGDINKSYLIGNRDKVIISTLRFSQSR